jgi:hypothetical protein
MARFYTANKLTTAMLVLTCLVPLSPSAVYGMEDNNEKKRKLQTVVPNVSNKKRELPIKNKNVTTPLQKKIPIKFSDKKEAPPFKDVVQPEIIPLYIQEKMREKEICDYIDQAEKYKDTSFSLLQTSEEHCSTLLDAIGLAEKSLIITTYQLNMTRKFQPKLFHALEKASRKGVKIQLFYNHMNENQKHFIQEDLGSIDNLDLIEIPCHAKLVFSDEKVAAIGSFNWLSDYKEELEDNFFENDHANTNMSFLVKGDFAKYLYEKYYSTIKMYWRMSCVQGMAEELQEKFSVWKIKNHSLPVGYYADVMLLRTPQDHHYYLQKLFDEIKSSLEIYSPFICKSRKHQDEILPKYKLSAFLETGKKLIIHYPDDHENRQFMNKYYGPTAQKYPKFELIPTKNMHEKLLIIDEKLFDNKIVIGSFNWLSSATSLTPEENLEEFSEDSSNLFSEEINNANMCDFSLTLSGEEARIKISELRNKKQIFSPEKSFLKQPKKLVLTKTPLETPIKKTVSQNRQPEISVHKSSPVILTSKKEKIITTESKEGKKSCSPKINVPIQVINVAPLLKKIEKPILHKELALLQPNKNMLPKSLTKNTNKPVVTHTKTSVQVVKENSPLKKFERPAPKKITSIPQPKKKALKTSTKKINERSKGYIKLMKSLENQPKITLFLKKNDK